MQAYKIRNFVLIGMAFTMLMLIIFNKNNSNSKDNRVNNDNPYLPHNSMENLNTVSLSGHEDIWKEILEASNEQLLINRDVLFNTIKFMLQETDEDDPKLIEFVRSLIVKPSAKPYNLTNSDVNDYSQIGQSIFIDELLKSKEKGFFIEAGAFDGEHGSNTLYFEKKRSWTGLLIEPIPSLYRNVLEKNRKAFVLNACIANKKPIVAKFRVLHVLSGRLSEMSNGHINRMNSESNTRWIAYIPCFSLNTILKALNVNSVDYFSLDVEGGEWDVINGLDLKKVDIKTFSIEYSGDYATKPLIIKRLEENNYKLVKTDSQDIYFQKN